MDKRLKSLMVDAIIDKAVDQNPIVDRIKQFLAEVDENAFLYLGGFVTLPKIGSMLVVRKGGKDVECTVEAINLIDATVTLSYLAKRTYYFQTTDLADNFTNTGKKGNYSDWDNEQSENYPYKGEHDVKQTQIIGFDQL